jgi:hypothetical protein
MALELKTTTGRLHGKQKTWAKEITVQISQTPDDTIASVNDFLKAEYINRKWFLKILDKIK